MSTKIEKIEKVAEVLTTPIPDASAVVGVAVSPTAARFMSIGVGALAGAAVAGAVTFAVVKYRKHKAAQIIDGE